MSTGARIPRGIEEFNPYIANTNAYLLAGSPTTNAVRLGIIPDEVTQWTDVATAWLPLYAKYSDKKNSRTTAIKDQLLSLIDQCVELDSSCHLLDRIAASPNVTIEDMGAFNIRRGILQKTTRSIPHTPISESITVSIQPLGGGSISIKCYSSSGERAAIYEDADSVQFVYQVGGTTPAAADVIGLERDISTKAAFTLALGSSSSSKYLYIYFRWYDTKRPGLAGPWSALQTTLIL
jgi:hypothetical protein